MPDFEVRRRAINPPVPPGAGRSRIQTRRGEWESSGIVAACRTRGAQRRSLPLSLRRPPGRPKGGALISSRAVHVRGEASRTPRALSHA
jgi:hypothetical protein